jgi:hypothetical protein
MSTIKVQNIQHTGSSTNAIALASDGTCTANVTSINGGQVSNRNVIINGEFQIAQRAVSTASITSDGYHTVDRWVTNIGTAGTWTQSRSTDVPAGTSFSRSLKMDCTTADSSLAAGDRLMLSYRLEGEDVQRFGKGTTNPKKFALSFWVKSPKTGTHIVELFDHDNNRHICKAYTISSANTWEQQKLVIDNETSNPFGNDNGKSLQIHFYLAAGSTYTSGTLATSWAAYTNANRAVGQVNVADSTSNDFYLCGVQLEASDFCTDFEHRSFGQELQLCKRYYQQYVNIAAVGNVPDNGSRSYSHALMFPVEMRAAPTITISNTGSTSGQTVTDADNAVYISSLLSTGVQPTGATISFYLTGDLTNYRGAYLTNTASTVRQTTYKIDAEL